MSEKKKIKNYFECFYHHGRNINEERRIGAKLIKGNEKYALLVVEETCKFILKSDSWKDFFKRLNSVWGIWTKAQWRQLGDSWLYENKDYKETIAKTMLALLKKKGLPTSEKEMRNFRQNLKSILSIEPVKIVKVPGFIFKKRKETPKTKDELILELQAKIQSL